MPSPAATMNPPIMTNSPWAKLMASVALYTSTKPSAMREYMSPIRMPLDIRRAKNCHSNTRRRLLHILDLDARLDRRLAAVLVGDRRRQLYLIPAGVEGVDDRRVLLGDEAAADLARARDLGVIGLQVLREQEEAPDLRGVGEGPVALLDLLSDERPDLGLLAQVRVARVRDPAPLYPVPDRVKVDGDHRGDEGLLVPERHRLPDERAELELVLDELRGEGRTVGQGPHILRAVDDDQVPAGIDEAGVARVVPPLVIHDRPGGILRLEVPLKDARTPDQPLSLVPDRPLGAGDRPPRRGRVRLPAGLERDEPRRLGYPVHLLEVHAERAEEAERVGAERRPARVRPARAAQAELVADGAVDEELAEPAEEAPAQGDRLAVRSEDLRLLGDAAEALEDPALEPRRVGRLHLHRGEHVLPDPRGREHGRGPELAQVALDSFRALRAVDREAHDQAQGQGVERVPHPRHRKVRQPFVVGPDILRLHGAVGRRDVVGVGEHGPLGAARRARRVADPRDVVGVALGDLRLEIARMPAAELPAELLALGKGPEPVEAILGHPRGVVVDDVPERRACGLFRGG